VTFDHEVRFELGVALAPEQAVAFVQDVPRSLARAHFLRDLRVGPGTAGGPAVVEASLPINASLFGQRDLPFRSLLHATASGARLDGVDVASAGPGWAHVSGEATVRPAEAGGSFVRYRFAIRVYVRLPPADRWGGKALTRMIEYTAKSVLRQVTAAFPDAVGQAARAAEAAVGRGAVRA
jgi:hypothetical protein